MLNFASLLITYRGDGVAPLRVEPELRLAAIMRSKSIYHFCCQKFKTAKSSKDKKIKI